MKKIRKIIKWIDSGVEAVHHTPLACPPEKFSFRELMSEASEDIRQNPRFSWIYKTFTGWMIIFTIITVLTVLLNNVDIFF